MNNSLLSLTVIALACSCTSVKPQSNKPPSYYGRTDAEIAAMEAQMGGAPTSSSSSQTMRTEQRHPYKRGDLAILIGSRQMKDKDSWSPVSSQLVGGINWNWEPSGSIIGFDTAFFYSEDQSTAQTGASEQTTVRGETYEFAMGGIKSFYLGRSPLRAYLGAGISMMSAHLDSVQGSYVNSGSDTGFGGYGRIGLVYQIAWDGHIGFDYRTVVGTSNEINGQEFDSDYDQFTFNFGTSF